MRRWRAWLAPAALVLATVSLAFNVYLVLQLRSPERWLRPAVERALAPLAGEDGTFTQTVRIPAGTPIRLDVPVRERVLIRIDTVLPINTRVRVPFDSPIGRRVVTLPIRADVPLRTQLPLELSHTFNLRTRTTEDLEIPIEFRLRDLLDPSGELW